VRLECFDTIRCAFARGLEGNACGDGVTDAVRTPFEKARTLAGKAEDAAPDEVKKKKKRLRKAARRLREAAQVVERQKKKGTLSNTCAEALVGRLRDAEERANALVDEVDRCR
jgi:hypothetical protein